MHPDGMSLVSSNERISSAHLSTHVKTGHYNGVAVLVKFLQCETQSLTLSRDELLELKLVSTICNAYKLNMTHFSPRAFLVTTSTINVDTLYLVPRSR